MSSVAKQNRVWLVSLAVAAIALLLIPQVSVGSGTEFTSDILIFAIMAIGLYVQIGLLGLVNFGFWDAAMYIVCPIAMGGIWLFFFFRRLEQRSLMPVNDPHFVEMLEAKHG